MTDGGKKAQDTVQETKREDSIIDETKAQQTESVMSQQVDRYQFVPGFGICKKGSAPVYMMDPSETPKINAPDAKMELLSVVYQDGNMVARTKITDYSAQAIPEDEAKALLNQEKENFKKQEAGELVEWDDSYITIDEEKGILVRSPYEERRKEAEQQKRSAGQKRYKCVYGEGAPEVGYSFDRITTSSDYDDYEENGFITTYAEYSMEEKMLETEHPQGVYEICMPGFEEVLSFEFVPAMQVEDLEELPGFVKHGTEGIYAIAESVDKGIEVQYYTYSDKNVRILLNPANTVLKKDNKTYTGTRNDEGWNEYNYSLQGITRGRQGDRILFEMPENAKTGDFSFQISKLTVSTSERSETLTLPVPGQEPIPYDHSVEFENGGFRITELEKTAGDIYYGNINGEEVYKPAVLMKIETKPETPSRTLSMVLGYQPEAGGDRAASPYRTMMQPEFDGSGDLTPEGKVVGFYAFYEPGEEEIKVEFRNPSYVWDQEFTIPLGMTAGN